MANQVKNNSKAKRATGKVIPVTEQTIAHRNVERQTVRKRTERARTTKTVSRRRKTMSPQQYGMLMLAAMVLNILLAIAVYSGSNATILRWIRHSVFGALGMPAYLLPIGLAVAIAFKAFNQGNRMLKDKINLSAFILMNCSVFMHILYVRGAQINLKVGAKDMYFPALANYFRISGKYHVGGGFLGGLFGDIFLILVGKWGALVLTLALFVVMFLLFTEISFQQVLDFLYQIGAVVFAWIRRKIAERQLRKTEKQEGWEQAIIEAELLEQEQREQVEHLPAEAELTPKKEKRGFFKNFIVEQEEDLEDAGEGLQGEPQIAVEAAEPEERVQEVAEQVEVAPVEVQDGESDKGNEWKVVMSSTENITDDGGGLMATESVVQPERTTEPVVIAPTPILNRSETPKEEREEGTDTVHAIQEELKIDKTGMPYAFPPLELLKEPVIAMDKEAELIEANAGKLEETLQSFGVSAKVINVSKGPTVTRYEIQPAQGVKVSRIVNLTDDIALNLAAAGIRMEAPIPGKSAIGIEVPNREAGSVMLREVLDSNEFQKSQTKLSFGLGKDISGRVLVTDIGKMPHLLIAGATGSGKSVCINTLIVSLLYKAKPEEVRLLMIDPKVVELSIYNGIPHLLIPVVTDPKKASGALNWAVQEMNDRYKLFAAAGVRDLKGYNQTVEEKGDGTISKLPQIVIIVDELADLMMVASGEVEDAICRLAQMARAAGLHLIIATQRPSVDVITGLIKANIPSRIAFNVSSGTDSRTILDMNGAEKLLGKGDMLFYPVGYPKPVRIQGAFISDQEVENIVEYLKTQQQTQYNQKILSQLNKSEDMASGSESKDDLDDFFADALELVVDKERASASMLQRYFRIGFNRAARILDQLTEAGYVGEEQGSKPRDVLLTRRELEALKRKAKEGNGMPTREELAEAREAESVSELAPMESLEADSGFDREEDVVNDAINEIMDEIQSRVE